MKKYVIIIVCLFILVGCDKKEEVTNVTVEFDNNYYNVYTPYKKGVGNNYIINNILNNYNIREVEDSLMSLSTTYFKTNNSYYQEGQYLKESELKTLLNADNLNKADVIKINDKEINPIYITSIYEQNFLASNGHLKGISLALILNPYQAYKNNYGNYTYEVVDADKLIDFGKKTANKLLEYMYDKRELKDIKILVGLYFQGKPNGILSGNFKYIGITTDSKIELEPIQHEEHFLDSTYVITNDLKTANSFNNIKNILKDTFDNAYISGIGTYQNKHVRNIDIQVTSSNFNKSEVLYLSQVLSEEIGKSFNINADVRVLIKSNDHISAVIDKKSNTLKTNIYIMRE